MATSEVTPIRPDQIPGGPTPRMRLESALQRIDEIADVLELYQATRCDKDVSALCLAHRELDLLREELQSLAVDLGAE